MRGSTSKKTIWRAYRSSGAIVFAPLERIPALIENGSISKSATLLHELEAATGEEAMTLHHQKMGWEPYKPLGNPETCPNNCGASYYPLGYGECPNCGPIS